MPERIIWHIAKDQTGLRLAGFLRQELSLSLKKIKILLGENRCHINGRVERFPATLLASGDEISFLLPAQDTHFSAYSKNLKIVFEDSYFVAIDKPVGVTAEDTPFFSPLLPLHRLDKETSGLWLFAKNKEAAFAMENLFRKRAIIKEYLAIVDGYPKEESGLIENLLAKQGSYQGQTFYGAAKKGQNGLKAITLWKVVKRYQEGYSLLRCYPKTGRTHQIRVHLAEMGYPILGDWHYRRSFSCSINAPRCLLHAAKLKFIHPFTEKETQISCDAPPDMLQLI